ncbi:MAG: nicotinamide mononucleotide transporter [Flavobacteriales bacterium]|nr:nicotinamide mononucleotide transporter [Flavobacteriales bacterium]
MNRILEISAVVLNLMYTILYLNGSSWCYLFGILGPVTLAALCLRNKLYAEPLLQLCYVGFAIYGWVNGGEEWVVKHWTFNQNLPYIVVSLILALTAGVLLKKFTDAKLPVADSVVTVFGITGTWLMVNYVHENWLYFIMINSISVLIYVRRKLYVGAAMFALYLFMAVDGYFELKLFYAW